MYKMPRAVKDTKSAKPAQPPAKKAAAVGAAVGAAVIAL